MGNFCGRDVNTGTQAGHASSSVQHSDAEQAVAAATGCLDYSTPIAIRMRCRRLKDVDALTKSDPMAILFREEAAGQWVEVGRTECVANNLDPCFANAVKISYNFEAIQRLRVLVVDIDKGQDPATIPPQKATSLGTTEFVLSELVTSKTDRSITKGLCSTANGAALKGSLTLFWEEVPDANALIEFKVAATGLPSRSDPFLQVSRTVGDGGQLVPVLRTEYKRKDPNPVWSPVKVTFAQLCNADPLQRLVLEVFGHKPNGSHVLMGRAETSVRDMQQQAGGALQMALTLLSPRQPQRPAGRLVISGYSHTPRPSFLDFVRGGTEINFVVAVDYTGSNGNPREPDSLHYIDPRGGTSVYENAILGVGRVLEYYDSDKLFPAYGFGGARRGHPTDHCFPLNDNPKNPYNVGVPGVQQAYRQALQTWALAGPTQFAPVIQAATAMAAQTTQHLRYTCLLILTDGEICDMDNTIEAIIDASETPMSILIVGLGGGSFENMVRLDGDNQRLSIHDRTAKRDIVQFVHFGKFGNDGKALASELLRELPGQLTQYMREHRIMPPLRLGGIMGGMGGHPPM